MDKLLELGYDISRLWNAYAPTYFNGVKNTLLLAIAATAIGCVIGLICGILNTIPYTKNDSPLKRLVLKLIRILVRIYVEIFRGTPMVLRQYSFTTAFPISLMAKLPSPVTAVCGWPALSSFPSIPALTWPNPFVAASSPLILARPKALRPSA